MTTGPTTAVPTSTTVTTAYNQGDQPISSSDGTTYTYTADGRLSGSTGGPGGTSGYGYGPFGEMTTATTGGGQVTYTLDAFGRMATRVTTAGTDRFSYEGTGTELTAALTADNVTTGLVRQPDDGTLVALAPSSGNPQAVIPNIHGDLAALRDANAGADTYRTSYDPTGGPQASSGARSLPIGYQSDYTDPITGQVDMGARRYAPSVAAFTTVDTIAGSMTRPVTLNRYLYANADPINYSDPDGHWSLSSWAKKAGSWAAGAVGSAVAAVGSAAAGAVGAVSRAVESQSGNTTAAKAASAVKSFVAAHGKQIAATAASMAVGFVATAGCEAITGGLGSVGCLAVGGAAGGAVYGAMNCPEHNSKAACATAGAITGAVGGATFGAASRLGLGAFGAGGLSAGATSAAEQYLTTGTVDPGRVATDAATGAVLGRVLSGSGKAPGKVSARAGAAESCAVGESVAAADSAAADSAAAGGRGAARGRAAGDSGAAEAEAIAQERAGGGRREPEGPSCPIRRAPHSFAGTTGVMLADGSSKPISEVRVGDRVVTTDPVTGVDSVQSVTATHEHQDSNLTDLGVSTSESAATGDSGEAGKAGEVGEAGKVGEAGAGGAVVHTTGSHPFWNQGQQRWTKAEDLRPGDQLRTASGQSATIATVANRTGTQTMYDLTVDTTHTYYVVAGETPVLVHNADQCRIPAGQPKGGQYASDPNASPRTHTRDSEYPSGYRHSTHDELAATWQDSDGNWLDAQGRIIPPGELTYDHVTPVVDHWNGAGCNMSREARNDWYNDPANLQPMTRSENSSGGGRMRSRYRQDTGPNYSR